MIRKYQEVVDSFHFKDFIDNCVIFMFTLGRVVSEVLNILV